MKCRATIKLKIINKQELMELFDSYKKACQYAADISWEIKPKHKFGLHKIVYKHLRQTFGLKAQFAINAISQGFATYKSSVKLKGCKPFYKSVAVRFDRRTFTFTPNSISLSTKGKRCIIPLFIPPFYSKYLDWRYQTADLKFINRQLFVNITFSKEVNVNVGSTTVGVDLGVNNLAVCSDGKIFAGYKTKVRQFQYLRSKLQAKGTKSAKRLLRKVSGRQKRYMSWVNHNVSKQIVSSADTIILENLKGIRKSRNKYMGKRLNRWLNSWSFHQLQSFISYKASHAGKSVIFINPYMTSQRGSSCGNLGSRYYDSFVCHCGFASQSDFNASCNLRRLHVTQPNNPCDESKAKYGTVDEHRVKSH